jgi:thiol-disulfide isomerase/thioredoxin
MPFLSRTVLSWVLLLTLLAPALSGSAVPDADSVMAQAKSQAASAHKNILLSFSASWCGNCRLFDKFLADPAIHPILDKAFIFADLDTGEFASDKRHANIPGGEKIEDSLGGKGVGYPYIVMLDPGGKLIVSSIAPASFGPAGNIGYPSAPNEVNWFMEMLKKAAPELSAQETATVRNWLTAHGSRH